jgi:myo-inositol-1(or 4)-monophosphatase
VTVIDFTAFIGRLATSSGETILPFFRTSLSIDNKSTAHDFDPVTEADRAAEAVMRRLIKASFPQHGIVGEEFGNEREDAEYVWVLDPIDGTKSFIAGFPIWGTLIALLHKGTPVFGMMHQPFIGERFSGDSGSAHYHGPSGERKLAVRRCASLKEATSFTTSPLLMNAADRAAFGRVEDAVRLTRYGGDCYSYCMLDSDHHRRRWHRHHMGGQTRPRRRPHHRGRRPARARSGHQAAQQLGHAQWTQCLSSTCKLGSSTANPNTIFAASLNASTGSPPRFVNSPAR